MMPQGTKDTGKDEAHLLEAEFEDTYVRMRHIGTVANFIHMLNQRIQAVVTYKVYKMNRTTRPFSEWVTVSDEAFLIICLENYSRMWRYEKQLQQMGSLPKGDDDEGNPIPTARYTGKQKGTKRSWSKRGLKTFNRTMVRVYQDRVTATPNGKESDALFMQHMKDVHEVSRKKADKNKHVVVVPRKKDSLILSDFNIGAYMAQMEESEGDNESEDDGFDKRDHNDSSNEDEREEEGNVHAEEV
jgi:hypothetical protein